MKYRQAPPTFECLYRRACPHMDGISAQWAFSVFQESRRLEDHIRKLEQDNHQLLAAKAELTRERDQIKAQFQALHRKQFKTGHTPTLPPPPPKSQEPRKRGPPPGHPPWTRPVPEHIDKRVAVPAPTICPHCACSDLAPSSESVDHVQEDIILLPRPFVTCFKHATAFCPTCRRPVYATAPNELRNCPIGPTTKATAIWLHHELKLPFRAVQALFATCFGMSFVPASALHFSLKAAHKGQPLYADLRDKIRAASQLHLDETSWRLDGEGAWLWYAGNRDLDFFHIDPSRAADVILGILGDHFRGDIISDDYAVYNLILARWRQSCLAHIIRTAKDIAAEIRLIPDVPRYAADIRFVEAMADFFAEVCALDKKRHAGKLSRQQARALVPVLRQRLRALCAGPLLHPKTLNLRDRLLSDQRDARKLFTFLSRPGMPPTNNLAERALRGPVLARKISFGSRSSAGANAFAVLASLLGTARRQQRPPIPFLFALLTANAATALAALYANSS